jgi:DinB superfamily
MDLAKYHDCFLKLFDVLKHLPEREINFKPAPDKWSIHEIVTHLADVEIQTHVRIRAILADRDPRMLYHDEMDWSVILDYTKVSLEESLEVIRLIRRVNYNLLVRLPKEYFDRRGIHSTRGELSLEQFINAYIGHVERHLNQIKRNIAAYSQSTGTI